MSSDLDQLFERAGSSSNAPTPDPHRLWAAGRRRRRRTHAAAGTGSIGAVVVLAAALVANLPPVPVVPEIVAVSEQPPATHAPDDEEAAPNDPLALAPAGLTPQERTLLDERQRAAEAAARQRSETITATDLPEPAPQTEPAPAAPAPTAPPEPSPVAPPEPDARQVAAPCAAHTAGSAFIDVAAPVDGQQVGDLMPLVGCASVYEGTVRYRVLAADGTVLVDRFTTASAGGPELGEFRASVPLPEAAGQLTVEVFWDSPADGEGERDLVRIRVVGS